MSEEAYIERLRLCPLRPKGPLPRVSARLLEIVRDHGVVEPIVVRRAGERYEILGNVEGWMAAQQARLDRVPIHILEDVSDTDAAEIVAAAFEGYSSNPIDEAEYFRSQVPEKAQGRADHKAVRRLAFQTGYARPYISHALRLLRLPLEIQTLVKDGRLGAGHARALVNVRPRRVQLIAAKQAVAGKLSVRQTESLAREVRRGRAVNSSIGPEGQPEVDPNVRALEIRVAERLGCSVSIDTNNHTLSINYHNLEILDGVLAIIGVKSP